MQIAEHRAQMIVPGGGAMIVAEYIDRNQRPRRGEDHISHQTRVRVADAQGHYERSLSEGADILQPPTDHEYGEREYVVRDIGGHRWTFAQTLFDCDPSAWAAGDVLLKTDE